MCARIRLSRFRLESPNVRLAFGVRRLGFGETASHLEEALL
jgi:hypothetical protein